MLALPYVPYVIAASDARSGAQQLAQDIGSMQLAGLDRARIGQLRSKLYSLHADIEMLRYLLAHDLPIGIGRSLAATHDVVAQADALLAASDDLAQAGDIALNLGDRFVALREPPAGASGHSQLAGVVDLMATSTADVDRIHDLIDDAQRSLAGIPADAPGVIRHAADLMAGPIERYGPLLDQYRAVDQILPQILGWGGHKRYLVLAQDPAELRPTGGYSGTVGIVGFADGMLVERSFQDVYQLDLRPGVPFVEPPEALVNHLLNGGSSWQLADANWSPDFPTSAQDALRLYTLESGDSNIDGVIALTTFALDRMLEVTGPVDVPEYGVTVHPGEVTLTALRLTRGISTPTSTRKDFLDLLATTVIDRLYSLTPAAWPALLQTFAEIGDERLMLAWFKDPVAQSLVTQSPMGGAVRQDAGDYVYVVEANVAPTSKYNLVVERRDALEVTIAPNGDATGTLRLDWQNNALTAGEPYASIRSYSESKTGIYGAYVRVLTPGASQLLGASGMAMDPINAAESVALEAGRNAFGNFLLIAPGPADLTYRWATPSVAIQSGAEWTYTLTIQKQPGLRPGSLTVTVALPAGATIDAVSQGAVAGVASVTFATTLAEDAQLQIRYRLP